MQISRGIGQIEYNNIFQIKYNKKNFLILFQYCEFSLNILNFGRQAQSSTFLRCRTRI